MTEVRSVPAPRAVVEELPAADPVAVAWSEYLTAVRQLDGVRRSAATAAGEQARSVQAAREELNQVRARLAAQQSRLRERGVPAMSLVPSPPEVQAAARSMAAGPAAVLVALRSARQCTEVADGVLDGRGLLRPAGWPVQLRNLLVYGVAALLVPLFQVVLVLTTYGGWTALALAGVLLAPGAYALGWRGVGWLFGRGAQPRLDRTPRFGALVCAVVAVVGTVGVLVAMLVR